MPLARITFKEFLVETKGLHWYVAGLPGFPRNFSRDGFLAGILSMDEDLLVSQLKISALCQGLREDPITGEEPGKIHHEFPGVSIGRIPYLTTYNACDTTALFLIAVEALGQCNQESRDRFISLHKQEIEAAIGYIRRHLQDNVFMEYPPVGEPHFSLMVTYWKDSMLPDREGRKEPIYPVRYALAHFQAARGILSAARLFANPELEELSDTMFTAGIKFFFTEEGFRPVVHELGALVQASSDELHSLAYIPAYYQRALPLAALVQRTETLMTPLGIACTPSDIGAELADQYHGYVVWPFEQAFLHYASVKFGLSSCAEVTKKITPYIDRGREYFGILPHIEPRGNDRQLWSVTAKMYFSDQPSLRQLTWL